MKKKILAIGGGKLRERETIFFDQQIVKLTEKSKPRALFIPTASGDSKDYYGVFQKIYGEELGCSTDVLYLLNENFRDSGIKEKILGADLIYVGGANTLMMMRRWRFTGAAKWLRKASESGTVMAGLSAGAMCWFEYGNSDSSFNGGADVAENHLIRIKGLGLVDKITLATHFDEEGRTESLEALIHNKGGIGIGLDNNAALEIVDDQFRVLSDKEGKGAVRYYKAAASIHKEVLEPSTEYSSIYSLLYKGQ